MPWLTTVTIVGVVVLAALIWIYLQMRSKDRIEEMLMKRRPSSKIASRAALLEGPNRIPVALSLAGETICYENADLDACLELPHIEEIEYDEETATGHAVHGRVLRLRSHGHAFDFEMDPATAKQWEAALPAKHLEAPHRQAV
jgi:hypothetical protein